MKERVRKSGPGEEDVGQSRGAGEGAGEHGPGGLAVRVEAVVAAYVLGAVLLAVPLGQHLALERGRALGHRRVGGRDPPPLGLLVDARVARVDGLDGRGRLDPARVGQVLGLGVVGGGGRQGRALGRQALGLLAQVGVGAGHARGRRGAVGPAGQHGARLGAAVLRGAASAPARGVGVVAERAARAARGLQRQRLHPGGRVRQQRGRVAREVRGRVVGRGREVQPVVGRRHEPALRRRRARVLGLLRRQQPVGVRHAAVRPRPGARAGARVETGLGVVAHELVLQERAGHGVAGAGHDLRARRVVGRRGQAVHVAARVDPEGKGERENRGVARRSLEGPGGKATSSVAHPHTVHLEVAFAIQGAVSRRSQTRTLPSPDWRETSLSAGP